jgi:hypothetical protein
MADVVLPHARLGFDTADCAHPVYHLAGLPLAESGNSRPMRVPPKSQAIRRERSQALARLSQLSRIPVQDGGIMGSIMSHPSMEKRVLALARAHNIPISALWRFFRIRTKLTAEVSVGRRRGTCARRTAV